MAYQEKKAASVGPIFVFAIVLVFLLLAAQYESWPCRWASSSAYRWACSAPWCLSGTVVRPTTSTPALA